MYPRLRWPHWPFPWLTAAKKRRFRHLAGAQPAAQKQKLKIEASFYPMYEFARQVAGDLAEVNLLIPPDVEPHDWDPTPQDMGKIEQADVLVYNGA